MTEPVSPVDLAEVLGVYRRMMDAQLGVLLTDARCTPVLHDAMRWVLLGGGKRMRPAVCFSAYHTVSGRPAAGAMAAACAVELVHTYSLVHDDLPAMDDDSERRGRATVHVKWDEATAILSGDALLTEAFRILADPGSWSDPVPPRAVLRVIQALGHAAGRHGMVGGQVIDMGIEDRDDTVEGLIHLHARKTGELFRFSAFAGAVLGGADDAACDAMATFGELLGLAFQVADDVLDLYEDREAGGRDEAETPSFPALIGEAASRAKAVELSDQAIAALSPFGDRAAVLRALARYAVERDH